MILKACINHQSLTIRKHLHPSIKSFINIEKQFDAKHLK